MRQWWADKHKLLTDLGVAGIWNDMNEPQSFHGEIPDDTVFFDEDQPSTHAQMHNLYAHHMARATYQGLLAQTGKRPFVITRAAFAGTQKYSTVWTGDNHSLWVYLQMMVPQLCNLGLSGFAFAGTDIGGFGSDTTKELLIRWLEAGIFSPLLRNHSKMGSRLQEPWQFDEESLTIYRRYLELRYQLLDYLYDLFAAGEKTGLPVMRPLVLHYQQDPEVRNLNDEFLVGESLLVAPVLTPGTTHRLVYLPAGEWCDFWTGARLHGGRYLITPAPLDHLPLFVKANTILPWRPVTQSVNVETEQALSFRVFGDRGQYLHYQDNGVDHAYQSGAFNTYLVKADGARVSVRLLHAGYDKPYQTLTIDCGGTVHHLVYRAATQQYEVVATALAEADETGEPGEQIASNVAEKGATRLELNQGPARA